MQIHFTMAFRRRRFIKRRRVFKRARVTRKRVYRKKARSFKKRRFTRRQRIANNFVKLKFRLTNIAKIECDTEWVGAINAPLPVNVQAVPDIRGSTGTVDPNFATYVGLYEYYRIKSAKLKIRPTFNSNYVQMFHAYESVPKYVVFPCDPAQPGITYGFQEFDRAMEMRKAKAYPLAKASTTNVPIRLVRSDVYSGSNWTGLTGGTFTKNIPVRHPWMNTAGANAENTGFPVPLNYNVWLPPMKVADTFCPTTYQSTSLTGIVSYPKNVAGQAVPPLGAGYATTPPNLSFNLEWEFIVEFKDAIISNT